MLCLIDEAEEKVEGCAGIPIALEFIWAQADE
jgi:hypothetical protein